MCNEGSIDAVKFIAGNKHILRLYTLKEGLWIACACGHTDIALFLIKDLENGLDPTVVGSSDTTPLQVAWQNKQWDLAKRVLLAISEKTSQQDVALSPIIISELLKVVSFREDALHVACNHGFLEAVRYIAAIGCDTTVSSSKGDTPLSIARSNGNMHVVQFLLKNDQRCAEPDMTEMHIECSVGLGEKEALVRGIPTISTPDSFGLIPLHYASCAPATLRILIDIIIKKINLYPLLWASDRRGNTP